MTEANSASLPYHEPGIVTILIFTSFLLLLNGINHFLDRIVYCGLLGQIFIGIAWGSPGAKWLSLQAEEVIVQLGYLGLILLVYEGGLSTSFVSLKANLFLSIAVALTGIAVPVALSFALQNLLGATSLQAFAAGASLCSTSLGTIFTILSSSGLTTTRLGVVLTSAAMMDDVVGLVMVQVISNLGSSGGSINATTIIRPVLVSVAFAVTLPLICRFVARPLTLRLNVVRKARPSGVLQRLLSRKHTAFLIHTAILIGLVTGASYAGTSNLFAAYLAGAAISWWDSELPHPLTNSANQHDEGNKKTITPKDTGSTGKKNEEPSPEVLPHADLSSRATSGSAIYEYYYQQSVEKILKPFFFASIGFSIPITHMFSGSVIWRGVIYTILMAFSKFICGLWLIRFPIPPSLASKWSRLIKLPFLPHLWGKPSTSNPPSTASRTAPQPLITNGTNTTAASSTAPLVASATQQQFSSSTNAQATSSTPPKPISLYPASILGTAMIARGEIGFLISAVAQSNGVFSSATSTPVWHPSIFLIVTWSIVLCTVIGPLGVGLLVRRVKRLERRREESARDVLGVWGVR